MASGTGGGDGGGRSLSPRPPPPPPSFGSADAVVVAAAPVDLSSFPPFPEPGSVVGPDGRYFCLGKLGRGTFCSIHRCVDLSYCHRKGGGEEEEGDGGGGGGPKKKKKKLRIVAAKVELSNFANSGVLDGEATVLRHLSSAMPEGTVPVYLDYVRQSSSSGGGGGVDPPGPPGSGGGGVSAIIMEYLPGEDMHHLRDRHCQSLPGASSANPANPPRRVSIPDAVYLTADVMLPLLREMHDAAVIHRDVKPSNCVRTGTTSTDRSFKMVDFGLSKSFVVPKGSGYADERYPWTKRWQLPPGAPPGQGEASSSSSSSSASMEGCFRKERPDADFRGTSMYASLRVHQGRDYCRRDDVWGLLYVFCDLVSGGLPWMAHAAGRDRNMCRIVKEIVHGERAPGDLSRAGDKSKVVEPGTDRIEALLMGADRHLSRHRRESIARATAGTTTTTTKEEEGDDGKGIKAEAGDGDGDDDDDARLPPLAPALPMASDARKVQLLRDAFGHVSKLGFADEPDYDLVGRCIRGFLLDDGDDSNGDAAPRDDDVPLIDWDSEPKKRKKRGSSNDGGRGGVKREDNFADDDDDDNDGDEGENGANGGAPYELLSEPDPLHDGRTLDEVERERRAAILAASDAADLTNVPIEAAAANPAASEARLTPEAADLARLPLSLQLRLAQVEYNARHRRSVPVHLALRDWMNLALSLVYDPWDAAKYERGNHRTDDDGYRRELREKVLERCLRAARPFGCFRDPACFYRREEDNDEEDGGAGVAAKKEEEEDEEGGSARHGGRKRRRISTSAGRLGGGSSSEPGGGGGCSPFLALSKAFFGVKMLVASEKERKFAPPPALSFG